MIGVPSGSSQNSAPMMTPAVVPTNRRANERRMPLTANARTDLDSMNGTMPATVNNSVGSCGMRLADGTTEWACEAKYPLNACLRSSAVWSSLPVAMKASCYLWLLCGRDAICRR